MAGSEPESPRETVREVSGTVPAMPVVKSGEIWDDSLFTLVEGKRDGLGWRGWPQETGGPGFVTLKRSAAGFMKVVKRYPLNGDGWAQAWRAFAELDRDGARRALDVLDRRAWLAGQAPAGSSVVDYGSFHADRAVVRDGSVSIPVDAVTGWAAKLTRVNYKGLPDYAHLLFRVVGPGDSSIELSLIASGHIGRKKREGHAYLDLLSAKLRDYGAKIITPVLVPQLCQQLISDGQVKVERLTISQVGLSRPGVFGARTLAWPEYFSSDIRDGWFLLFRRNQPGSSKRKRRPWYKMDIAQTNAVVLPPLLTELDQYFNPK
jgi:hypothetical protein